MREYKEAQDDEQDDLGDKGEPFVEGDELLAITGGRAAYGKPDEVDGEEAATAHDIGGTERNRRHRNDATGANPPIEPGNRANSHATAAPSTRPTIEAQAELANDEQREISEPIVVRLLDPRDQAKRERDRHRIIPARLGLQACERSVDGCA